jgi:hypothetical protein
MTDDIIDNAAADAADEFDGGLSLHHRLGGDDDEHDADADANDDDCGDPCFCP